jgi:4-alpha-glucanotransferase
MTTHETRRGVLLPLFSAVSSRSWGIGDCGDVAPLVSWLASAGFGDLMLLPLGTMSDGQSSPYSACSAMAIDPIYIDVASLEDFQRAGGIAALDSSARDALDVARASARVNYAAVGHAKSCALDLAFARFQRDEWAALTPRASSLAAYISSERWWLDDYALFRALTRAQGTGNWTTWPAALAQRDPAALADIQHHLQSEVLREQYLQWVVEGQWQQARRVATAAGVRLYGDVPFAVDASSADVWSRAGDFRLDLSAGVPPDAFSATGQDWGLPVYRWDVIAAGGFAWLNARGRRAAALYDGIRLDHLVGFFRTYARTKDGDAGFTPSDEADQRRLGEQVLAAVRASGVDLLAEDLGVIPDFVRIALQDLHVPGYKVFRWERAYDQPGQPFIDPSMYPRESIAATGTHDTETHAEWWPTLTAEEQRSAAGRAGPFDPDVRDILLTRVLHAASSRAFIPMADLFGWTDRVNTPATVGDHNWTWRLPWPIDRWPATAEARERAEFCRRTIRGE